MKTPEWVKHAVFYQVFPDRFARSSRLTHPPSMKFMPWGTSPAEQGYQGGDLYGVVDKLDYLQDLGITAIYFTPIFASASNHRYHTFDYFQVDPLLGGNAALRELLDEAHRRNMYIVLDGVFNHASRGFWPFHHVLENGGKSPYLDWFIIHDWPLRPYANDENTPPNYEAWANIAALPKLNTANPDVQQYIYDVTRYWLEFGIDGWRLDVPFEIDDIPFWQKFREVVKSANQEAYIVGEIWREAQRWLQGDQFDAVMNYQFSRAAMSFFGCDGLKHDHLGPVTLPGMNAQEFADAIDRMHSIYDWEINHVQLNLLDSHDTPRATWLMGDDQSALRLCVVLQMTMPGAPCIYYGDEIGLSAAGDPHCREAYPWNGEQDADLLAFYQAATAMRHKHRVLRTGNFTRLYADHDIYAFMRQLDEQQAIAVFNAARESQAVRIVLPYDAKSDWQAVWGQDFSIDNGNLQANLAPREALVLIA